MVKALIVTTISYWFFSSLFVIYWHHKQKELNMMTILGGILLGPILIFFIRQHYGEIKNRENNNRLNRGQGLTWFQLHDRIRRESISARGFHTIPPPPPISQRKEIKKDFKFFRG